MYNCEAQLQGALITLQSGAYEAAVNEISQLIALLDKMNNNDYKKNNQYVGIKIRTLELMVDCYWNLGNDDEMKKYGPNA